MKFTLNWLKHHLDADRSLDDIVLGLTALGLEVDGVEDRARIYAPFHVAHVISAEKHPDADRLRVCIVDTGTEKIQVVCGAPNARAGMKAVFAPAGSYIPGSDITLKKGVIRGQESNGMLVSEREMGLSGDHEGIIDVAADIPVGTPFAQLYRLDDPVIEIGLTPNRADCAGIRGIARDLAAAGYGTLKPLDESPVQGRFKNPVGISLAFDSASENACPLFLGRMIRGVKNGPSPQWMQDRLIAIGQKPISLLVDITNYFTFDLCRPLHVFDAGKINGNLHVRLSKKGESLEALNGKTYDLEDGMTVVCDDSGALGLGGIIGGTSTSVSEATRDVYIEAAYFDPWRTARTGRLLQIDSDARYRFERGIDAQFTIPAMEMATRMILDLCGGEASDVIMAGTVPSWQRTIRHDPAYVRQLAGFDIDPQRQKKILTDLGFTVKDENADWIVQPPSWRGDIDARADLVEEIVRVHGYDKIPAISMPKLTAVTRSAETPSMTRARRARTVLATRGFDETLTWSFMDRRLAEKFGANDHQDAAGLTLSNPISSELDFMRPSILPNLIQAAGRNHDRGYPDSALCEIGPVFESRKKEGQRLCAAGLRSGSFHGRHWSSRECARAVDAMDAKADALAVLEAAGCPVGNLQISRDAPSWHHPGRSGILRLGPTVLARFGEIHPALLEEMKIAFPVAAFEVFLDAIPLQKKKGETARSLLQLSPFQPLSRDFAFIVDAALDADALIRAARSADKTLIGDVSVFDVYQGKGVEAGRKSVAIAVTLQPRDKTLTDKDIEDICNKIIANVTAKTGGQLRA
ncbi:MAG TPA: phenylalanine--tRNA ligase subunit beta [Micavibrio sp.]|jgi:phenylalanyl-tRNA synthetase beta chain